MNLILKKFSIISIILIFSTILHSQQIYKIPVNPQKAITETNCGNAYLLFEEQLQAGDPKNGNGGNIVNTYSNQIINTWECGYSSNIQYPAYAYVDLGKVYNITNIYLRDVNSSGLFSIFYGYPGSWNFLLKDNCKGYNSWNAHNINNIKTRYLRFKKDDNGAKIAEMVIYGFEISELTSDSIPPSTISDLQIDSTTYNDVYLNWTQAYDSHLSFYEIRYSNSPITKDNYLLSSKSDSNCLADNNLVKQYFKVSNLNSGTPYYFAIISYDSSFNFSEISNIIYAKTKIEINAAPHQIIIEQDMIINEMAIGNSEKLADEQTIILNNNFQNNISNYWDIKENNVANNWHYPLSIVIDLGNYYKIKTLAIYNQSTINSNITAYFNNQAFQNSDSIKISLDTAYKWKICNNLNYEQIRYIRIATNSPNVKMGEIYLWGSAETNNQPEIIQNTTNRKFPLINEFIGVNAFNNDPIGKLNCAGFIREYHNWEWNEGMGTSLSNPYIKGNIKWDLIFWDFDDFYKNIANQRLGICPVIQNNVSWLTKYNGSLYLTKPLDSSNLNPINPSSYKNHANFMFQMAARYGANTVDLNKIQVNQDQIKKTGLNFLKYYENWNEQNKWWKGRSEFFSPYEYCAMTSTDYDGHENTVYLDNHNNLGIKTADPTAKLVMGGLAEGTLEYIKAMNFWSQHFRNDKKTPIDVINTHEYFNMNINNNLQGVSPEDFKIKEKMVKFVNYRNKYMPDKEIWLSEFGYNTSANTIYSAPEIGNCSREEIQARWLLRSFLELAASGIDKAIMYRLSDEEEDNVIGNTYCTSGITSKRSLGYAPKSAWFYIYTLKNNLFKFRFSKEITTANNNIKIYEFEKDSSNEKAYAIWCPTSINQTINNYTFNLPPDCKYIRKVEFENGSINGLQIDTLIDNNIISLNISEKPILLITSSDTTITNEVSNERKIYLDSTMIINESSKGIAKFLVDEQTISGEPFLGNAGNPVTNWHTSYNANDYPASAYIDLGHERNISQIYLYDSYSICNYEISYGTPSNWISLFSDESKLFQTWSNRVVDVKTRYIRITLYKNANINEIVLYEK